MQEQRRRSFREQTREQWSGNRSGIKRGIAAGVARGRGARDSACSPLYSCDCAALSSGQFFVTVAPPHCARTAGDAGECTAALAGSNGATEALLL